MNKFIIALILLFASFVGANDEKVNTKAEREPEVYVKWIFVNVAIAKMLPAGDVEIVMVQQWVPIGVRRKN